MGRKLHAALLSFLLLFGVAQLASRADDDAFPVDIMIIIAKTQGGMPPSADDMKRLHEYGTRHEREAVNGVTMADVIAICHSAAETHSRPSAADIAKMRAWAAGMKARTAQLKKDAQDLSKALIGTRTPTKTAPPKPNGRADVVVDSDITSDAVGSSHHQHDHVTSTFAAKFPVTFKVKDGDDLKIDWDDGAATVASCAVKGSFTISLQSDDTEPHSKKTSQLNGTFPINVGSGVLEGSTIGGGLVFPKGGARAYLKGTASCQGATKTLTSQEHRHVDPPPAPATAPSPDSGPPPPPPKTDFDSTTSSPVAAMPMTQLSIDEFAVDGPFSAAANVPKEYRQLVASKLPPEFVAAARAATCDFNADQFRKNLATGKPFTQPFRYTYSVTTVKTVGNTTTTTSIKSSVSIGINYGDTEADLDIVPDDAAAYEKWLPVPYTTDDKVAKAFNVKTNDESVLLKIVVGFHPKPGADLPKGKLQIDLQDVSTNKGICCNYPPRGADSPKGLFFPADKQDKGLIVENDGLSIRSEKEVSQVTVRIAARESGAYGNLIASCPERNVEGVWKASGKKTAPIPKDDNGNHVAVSWGGKGHPATWDADSQPADQRDTGDGLTLYEEYRGFICLKDPADPTSLVHVRTDPDKKDAFVYDKNLLFKKNYFPENPSQLVWHYVDENLMRFSGVPSDPENRWINVNTPDALQYAKQYVIVVVEDDSLTVPDGVDKSGKPKTKPDGGVTDSVPGAGNAFLEPVKNHYQCRINVTQGAYEFGGLKNLPAYKGQPDKILLIAQDAANAVKSTVIHEVGHFLGIHHHFPPGATMSDSPWPETADSEAWGVIDCCMRYDNGPVDILPVKDFAKLYPLRSRYCTKSDQGFGPDWKTPQPSDNCWGQIKVKSDP
jgi:hypothetical protein